MAYLLTFTTPMAYLPESISLLASLPDHYQGGKIDDDNLRRQKP